jgi:hypothetical protein
MMRLLKLLGVILLLSCLIQFLLDHGPLPSIEATIDTRSQNSLIWAPSAAGRYFVYICYRADVVPSSVRETFLNWKHPPRTNWEAFLTLTTNGSVCLSKKDLELEPAIESGERLYFLVGQCEIIKPARVEVDLRPEGAAPFGGVTPCLALRPSERAVESYYMTKVFWRAADLCCIPVALILLVVCVRSCQRRAKVEPGTLALRQ